MPSDPRGFSLLAASAADFRRKWFAEALAGALDLLPVDAALLLRKSRGILREGLSRREADRLAAALGEAGAVCLVLPDVEVVAPPPARVLSRVKPVPEGLEVGFPGGGREVVPWERMAVLSFGSWWEEVTVRRQRVPWGLPEEGARAPVREKATTTEIRNVLDLVLEGPEERLRLDGEEYCDFAGLGDARAPTVLGNLRALAEALAAAVPSAGLSRGLELLLEGGRVSDAGYEAEEDLLREQRWLLALRRARM